MIPILGLIIAAYAIARLVQIPIEMTASKEEWLGLPFMLRFIVLTAISAGGVFVIAILTLMLLAKGS